MENNDFKVIEEHNKYYVIEDENGNQKKAVKIRRDAVQKIHDDSNKKVAENIDVKRFLELVSRLEDILNNVPTIDKYKDIAVELANFLRQCYDNVGNPNLFHHPIKNIDPDIYGRANTLLKEVKQLYESMIEVGEMMKHMNKIGEFQSVCSPYQKFVILIRSEATGVYKDLFIMKKQKSHQIEGFTVEIVYKVVTKIT
jgi:hypothetical protein